MNIIAIGDIHGCFKELKALMGHIEKNIPTAPVKYIFIGDYVDRGPQSKEVIEYLIYFQKHYDAVFLMGNHEDMLLHEQNLWMANGGRATLQSYDDGEGNSRVFPRHIEWIKNLQLYHVDEMERIFVHAGIKRSIASMDMQPVNYMLWAREQFFNDKFDDRFVIHGHTALTYGGKQIKMLPIVLNNRVNLDTGCGYGGALSAALFNDKQKKPYMLINHLGEINSQVELD